VAAAQPESEEPTVVADATVHADSETEAATVVSADASPEHAPELHIQPALEIITGYQGSNFESTDGDSRWYHEFVLDRAHAILNADYGPASARIILESVYSAGSGSLVGIGGNSLVLRIREAWAGYTLLDRLTVRVGVVRQFVQPTMALVSRLRPVGRTPDDELKLHHPTDLGANATFELPARYGELGLGVYNGEGYTQRELNRGKNLEAFARVAPLASIEALVPLSIMIAYVSGSSGTASARADRYTAGLLWDTPVLSAGAVFTYAHGLEDDGTRKAWHMQGFARTLLFDHLILGARASYFVRNTKVDDDTLLWLVGTVGAVLLPGVETYVSLERRSPGAVAQAALPDSNEWRGQLIARVLLGM
ncbi:MAG: hypothetical protein R3A78_15520, partial [Polyangiales bacterium]